MQNVQAAQQVREELSGLDLGDKRREERAVSLAVMMAQNPQTSFPDLAKDDSELEALYRFHSNENISFEQLLQPHMLATAKRCAESGRVLALHDTSEFSFSGRREDLVEVGVKSAFHGHFTLAVRPQETPEDVPMPLGCLGLQPFLSNRGAKGIMSRGKQVPKDVRAERYNTPREEKESFTWDIGVLTAEQQFEEKSTVRLIHVADQEMDDYAFLSLLVENKFGFVVRGDPGRLATADIGKLPIRQILESQAHTVFRDAEVSPRRKRQSGIHPKRDARTAKLHIRGGRIELKATKQAASSLREIALNVVHVFEPNPPAGDAPIEWTLYTSEPIETLEQLRFVVDAYRARWLIEEFFKAIKTGCAYEKRQLGSGRALLNTLALCIPIAWSMLALRAASRSKNSDLPARLILSASLLETLRLLQPKAKLGTSPTIRQALLAIATHGGHIKNNGEPGFITLYRGYKDLLVAESVIARLQNLGALKDVINP
jgi:IS4 transposase